MEPRLIATGDLWVGQGVRSFSATFQEILSSSKLKISMTAYSLTDERVMSSIVTLLERGIEIDIFITAPEDNKKNPFSGRLYVLADRYKKLRIYDVGRKTVHAKVVVADHQWILLGSANLSFSGFTNNYELGILLEDPVISQQIEEMLSRLIK